MPDLYPTPTPYLVCPDCLHRVYFDDANQAAGMDEMDRHVQWRHPLTDRTPAVLRPRIKVVTGV